MGLRGPKTTSPAHEAKDVSVFGDMAQRVGKPVQTAASVSMDVSGPVGAEIAQAEDLAAEFVPGLREKASVVVAYQGPTGLMRVSLESAKARLSYLEGEEATTKRFASTHPGLTGTWDREAEAIRAAIAKSERGNERSPAGGKDYSVQAPGAGIAVTKKLVSNEHGFDDFDITGMPKVHRVCVPHDIKKGDIFNVYCDDGEVGGVYEDDSVKLGAKWRGSVEKSLEHFAETNSHYQELIRKAGFPFSQDAKDGSLTFHDHETGKPIQGYEGPFHPAGHTDKVLHTWKENGERAFSDLPRKEHAAREISVRAEAIATSAQNLRDHAKGKWDEPYAIGGANDSRTAYTASLEAISNGKHDVAAAMHRQAAMTHEAAVKAASDAGFANRSESHASIATEHRALAEEHQKIADAEKSPRGSQSTAMSRQVVAGGRELISFMTLRATLEPDTITSNRYKAAVGFHGDPIDPISFPNRDKAESWILGAICEELDTHLEDQGIDPEEDSVMLALRKCETLEAAASLLGPSETRKVERATDKSVLGIYTEFFGGQGESLQQALEGFKKLPLSERDRFCSRVMNALDSNSLADVENAGQFFKARL